MTMLRNLIIAAAVALPAVTAYASQGPGTTGGTATMLDKGILCGCVTVAIGIGLMVRLRHR